MGPDPCHPFGVVIVTRLLTRLASPISLSPSCFGKCSITSTEIASSNEPEMKGNHVASVRTTSSSNRCALRSPLRSRSQPTTYRSRECCFNNPPYNPEKQPISNMRLPGTRSRIQSTVRFMQIHRICYVPTRRGSYMFRKTLTLNGVSPIDSQLEVWSDLHICHALLNPTFFMLLMRIRSRVSASVSSNLKSITPRPTFPLFPR